MVTVVALATVAVVAAIAVAWLPRFARSLEGQIDGLSALFGGWRQAGWPSGIQEDDTEARWADRHGRPPVPRPGDREPGPASPASDMDGSEPRLTSWIEELD